MRKKVWMFAVPILLIVICFWAGQIAFFTKFAAHTVGPLSADAVLRVTAMWLMAALFIIWTVGRLAGSFAMRKRRFKAAFAIYETSSLTAAGFIGAVAAIAVALGSFTDWLIAVLLAFAWLAYEKRGVPRWKRRLGLLGFAGATCLALFILSRT